MKQKATMKTILLSWIGVLVLLFIIPALIPRSYSLAAHLVIQNTIMILVILLANHFWLKIDLKLFSTRKFFSQFLVAIPVIAYLAFMVFGVMINLSKEGRTNTASILIQSLVLGLFAGLFEELYFRGIVERGIFILTSKHAIYYSVVLSSLLFSLSHLIVNFNFNDVPGVFIQMIATFGSGIYMGALYIRTRNLLWPLLLHSVNDFVSIASSGGSIAPSGNTDGGLGFQLLLTLVFILLGLFLIRKKKHEEIIRQFN